MKKKIMKHLQYLGLFSFRPETELTDWWQVYKYLYDIHSDDVDNGYCYMYLLTYSMEQSPS